MIKKWLDLKFRSLELNDLKLIYDWFKVPEINQWYAQGKVWLMADIEAKYKPRLIDQEVVPSFIIVLDSNDIGFIQYYSFSKTSMPEGLSFEDADVIPIRWTPIYAANAACSTLSGVRYFSVECKRNRL